MRPQASTRRSLARSIFATTLVIGLLAAVPGSPPAGAQSASDAWTITTVAGDGDNGNGLGAYGGDGGQATSAQISPIDAQPDGRGNLYIADGRNHRVRKVDADGVITTVAGTGVRGFSGDGGSATSAKLSFPVGLAIDRDGNVFVADLANRRVRKIDTQGIITTVAGTGAFGFSGDGGPATSAKLSASDLAFDASGNLFIAGGRVRKVVPGADGVINGAGDEIITTVAGNGAFASSGDGGPATSAAVNASGIDLDPSGNLYIADASFHRVRKVDTAGIITTFAGGGTFGYGGDGGPATSAYLHRPGAVAVQGSGNVFISDTNSAAIRRVDASGTIESVAGTGPYAGSQGDGGFAPYAGLRQPRGLGLDDAGNLYIADAGNYRIRRVETSYLWITSTPRASASTYYDYGDPTHFDDDGYRTTPAPQQPKVGDTFSYQLNVSGLPATANGVQLTAALAPQVAFVGSTTSQGSCAANGGTVTCQLGSVEPGTTATVQLTVTAGGAGLIPITAAMSSELGEIPGNRTATAYTKASDADCGQTITANTVLTEDIGPCTGNGAIVGRDAINFDLGGKRIFGFAGPGDGFEAGIRVTDRSGVTVTNGTVTDFDAGVAVTRGGSNTVSRMTIRDNVGPDSGLSELGDGIAVIESPGNFVLNNVITNSGIYDGIGVLGVASDNNTVEGNTIENTFGLSYRGPFGQGIIVNAASFGEFTSELITGTKIKGNVIRNSGSAGIANINNVNGEIVLNTVENNGYRNLFGNGIGVQLGQGLPDDNSNLLIQGNQVHRNQGDGIHIPTDYSGYGADENRILNNNAANNGRRDLFDGHDDCVNNVWRNNTWGSGGYSPECVTLGGKGPRVNAKGRPEAAREVSELPQRGKPGPSALEEELGTP